MNLSALKKASRFIRIYGPMRTSYKIFGRTRLRLPLVFRRRSVRDLAIIGCGQFGFSTIGYFIARSFGARFLWCYDTAGNAAKTFQYAYRTPNRAESVDDLLADPEVKIVYIASNHSSHTDYACAALAAGKDVYVEKPVSVSMDQLQRLNDATLQYSGRIFAGYNRPLSSAVETLKSQLPNITSEGVSLNCFVSGHQLAEDHWYRDANEGTRICGNAGHWIDLFVHLTELRSSPDLFRICLLPANTAESDDNFCLSIATDKNDVFSLMLTARSEPFEGINETINFQQGGVTCKIDDFRRLTLWNQDRLLKETYWPKDVGHKNAVLQPFQQTRCRAWNEVIRSTVLMLTVMEMVKEGRLNMTVSMKNELEKLNEPAGTS